MKTFVQKCRHGVVMVYGYSCECCEKWYQNRGMKLPPNSQAFRGAAKQPTELARG